MSNSQNIPVVESDLYKAFFDDATLSDLTIQLSDRTVRVHRIVLCRKSEYFTKLLTGRFQENGSKEIELKEDDGNSMVALLRYIYDLPYHECFGDQRGRLQPHAEAYVVAEKYQVHGLKLVISKNLRHMIHSERDLRKEGDEETNHQIAEFMDALKIIVAGTPAYDNNHGRNVMVEACVLNLRLLHQTPEFLSLLRESSDLGADIIGHQHLECGLPGDWVCEGNCDDRLTVECGRCATRIEDLSAVENRYNLFWLCEGCGSACKPMCVGCSEPVKWKRRGL